jgi:hypothetical protein
MILAVSMATRAHIKLDPRLRDGPKRPRGVNHEHARVRYIVRLRTRAVLELPAEVNTAPDQRLGSKQSCRLSQPQEYRLVHKITHCALQ